MYLSFSRFYYCSSLWQRQSWKTLTMSSMMMTPSWKKEDSRLKITILPSTMPLKIIANFWKIKGGKNPRCTWTCTDQRTVLAKEQLQWVSEWSLRSTFTRGIQAYNFLPFRDILKWYHETAIFVLYDIIWVLKQMINKLVWSYSYLCCISHHLNKIVSNSGIEYRPLDSSLCVCLVVAMVQLILFLLQWTFDWFPH